jgi:hypothetical protein
MQVIGGPLRMRGCGEDRAVVVLQHVELGCEIGRVIVARFGRQTKIGREKRRPEFGDQFLRRIARVAPTQRALR